MIPAAGFRCVAGTDVLESAQTELMYAVAAIRQAL
jgi:hypothetical protein